MLEQKFELDDKSVRQLMQAMNAMEDDSKKQLSKDMKTKIKPLGNEIARKVPSESPFIGMTRNRYGRVQWEQPKAKVSVTPGKSTRQRGWASVVTLILEHKTALGFAYTENAGPRRKSKRPMTRAYQRRTDSAPRQHANTRQGDALIAKAKKVSTDNFAAGHFAYGNFLRLRPAMIGIAQVAIDAAAKRFSIKVERR